MNYRTVTKDGNTLVEVKRSKFIGIIRPVSSAADAKEILRGERKKYHDAKHHCSAYIIRGENGAPDTLHSSDDGEPSGTAGAPIMEVLKGAGVKDVVLVVTRYFGGTLLGTGGLVRAYTDAAHAALEDAVISEMVLMQHFTISFDYSFTGSIDHYIQNHGISRLDATYTDKVEYTLAIPEDRYENTDRELVDLTSSAIRIQKGPLTYTAV